MLVILQTPPVRDPLEGLVNVVIALVIVLCVSVTWMARDDIGGVVKSLFNRYVHFKRHNSSTDDNILSSWHGKEDVHVSELHSVIPDTYQSNTSTPEPVREPVQKTVLPDSDIIAWLAYLKNPGKTAYRFSSNQIAELMRGTRSEVLKKVAECRPDVQKPTPETNSTERMMRVRDHEGTREIPI